jgi:hypothetical protein
MGNQPPALTREIVETTDPIDSKFVFSEKKDNVELRFKLSLTGLDFIIPSLNISGDGRLLSFGMLITIRDNNAPILRLRRKLVSLHSLYRIESPDGPETHHKKDSIATVVGDYVNFPFMKYEIFRRDKLVLFAEVNFTRCDIVLKDRRRETVAVATCDYLRVNYTMSFAAGVDVLLCAIVFVCVITDIRQQTFANAENASRFHSSSIDGLERMIR